MGAVTLLARDFGRPRAAWDLYRRLIAVQIRAQLEYRVSFVTHLIATALATGSGFATLALVLQRFEGIGGWSLTDFHYFGMPTDPPFITAEIRHDGSDTNFYHLVSGFDLSDLELVRRTMKIGTHVRAVWRKEKKGCILDIEYFEPIG